MKTWVTREGQTIPIEELEQRHLMNIFRMLLRVGYHGKIDAVISMHFGTPRGDGAVESWECELRRIENATIGEFAPAIYKDIVDEIKRRDASFNIQAAEIAYEEELAFEKLQTYN